jgi:adenine-specific DNA-methyltransferase
VQSHASRARITKRITNAIPAVEAALASNLYLLLFPKGTSARGAARRCAAFPAVFQALRKIDTDAFIREGRVYGGGLYKMEPKELGRLAAEPVEPVVEAMGGWQPVRQGVLFADR